MSNINSISDIYIKISVLNRKPYYIPIKDYLDIRASQYGCEDYDELIREGAYIDLSETNFYTKNGEIIHKTLEMLKFFKPNNIDLDKDERGIL